MKYIDAEKLKAEIERLKSQLIQGACAAQIQMETNCKEEAYNEMLAIVDSLQQEQPIPDSTQLIAEWEKEKAVLKQKDFRGDAERMAYNAFLDGLVKGLGYEGTK